MKRINYLNNKDMLTEIHKSKNTFSSFVSPEYSSYDIIISDKSEINSKTISSSNKKLTFISILFQK